MAGGSEDEAAPDAGKRHRSKRDAGRSGRSRRRALGRQALDKTQRLSAVGAARCGRGMDGEAAGDVIGGDRNEGSGEFADGVGGGRIEPVAAQRVLAGDRRMFEVAGEPGVRRQREGGRRCAVGLVAGDDALVVGGEELRIAQGAAAQVAGQIQQHALAMCVALAQPDVPGGTAEAVDEGRGALGGGIGGQA